MARGNNVRYENKKKEMGDLVQKNTLFFVAQVIAFACWAVPAFLACADAVFTRSYNEASTLYFNVFSYNHLMPSAFHLFSIAITAFMLIHRGISCYYFNHNDTWAHTGWLIAAFPLYGGALVAWCCDQPWITFGLTCGAFTLALISLVNESISAADSASATSFENFTNKIEPMTLTNLILGKLPTIILPIFFYYEAWNAMFGAATISDPDLAWKAENWYMLIHALFILGMGNVYLTGYNHNFIYGFTTAGVFITNAIVQRGTDPTGFLWIVTVAYAVIQLVGGFMALSYSINVFGIGNSRLVHKA